MQARYCLAGTPGVSTDIRPWGQEKTAFSPASSGMKTQRNTLVITGYLLQNTLIQKYEVRTVPGYTWLMVKSMFL
jgi:hypothetical protein